MEDTNAAKNNLTRDELVAEILTGTIAESAAAREALIAAYAEKARREIVYGSSEFAGFYARSAAHYALRYR